MGFFVKISLLCSILFSTSVFAVTIDARQAPYSSIPAVQGVTIGSNEFVRAAGMLALVGAYRSIHGNSSISNPSQVQIVWTDGSKEKAAVTCNVGTPCVAPIPGTEQSPPEGGSGGSDPGGGSSSGSGGISLPATTGSGSGSEDEIAWGEVGELRKP